jgi:hypothetical protein
LCSVFWIISLYIIIFLSIAFLIHVFLDEESYFKALPKELDVIYINGGSQVEWYGPFLCYFGPYTAVFGEVTVKIRMAVSIDLGRISMSKTIVFIVGTSFLNCPFIFFYKESGVLFWKLRSLKAHQLRLLSKISFTDSLRNECQCWITIYTCLTKIDCVRFITKHRCYRSIQIFVICFALQSVRFCVEHLAFLHL